MYSLRTDDHAGTASIRLELSCNFSATAARHRLAPATLRSILECLLSHLFCLIPCMNLHLMIHCHIHQHFGGANQVFRAENTNADIIAATRVCYNLDYDSLQHELGRGVISS